MEGKEEMMESVLLMKAHTREKKVKQFAFKLSRICRGQAGSEEDQNELISQLAGDLSEIELEAVGARFAALAAIREIESSEKLKVELEKEIMDMDEVVKDLKSELEAETFAKRNRERYSALAKVISASAQRSTSQKEIDSINEKLKKVESEGERLASKKELLGKQLLLLTQTIEDLTGVVKPESLEKEEEKEEGEADERVMEEGEHPDDPEAMEIEEGQKVEHAER
uniref:THO complex subunit 7 homolog n=2 Tax=Rhodosorus marinus TaxID=101924 RepID=A0A7S2ZEG1_9RHOD|mmetsp:Transcript_16695/g.68379  ORF Transcript_16695/g.68379 Transcript_16695/m.68379 type:complete len:226 (+) Transcript_16695:335-1012(+)|eukprot:CAMPEP_0113959860 /NCGR_PEP_ID=MMETSP0011_2-20120614/4386_1 /TAXON_ID=101924 /ORGANISM="Rhodosorus marinus" /LENGTH=225 /DNA_ID=CAMNT_0000971233 /DNA_START=561 /DNA_END=1238 /DNA_ORIENTATION=+ /assembly_acc=CAM_ASM_000156